MTEYPRPLPEGSRGGTPTGFPEESEADPAQGVTATSENCQDGLAELQMLYSFL